MERQLHLQRQIARVLTNFRKVGRGNYTPALIRSRIQSLKGLWAQFMDQHVELENSISDTTKAAHSYFTDRAFEQTEDVYDTTMDRLAEALEELEPPRSPSIDGSFARPSSSAFSLSHLPPIQLPPFDGNVAEWEQFRDRFSALIISNKELNDFARFHFLVSFLRGPALQCLSNLSVTADNFAAAWKTLNDRYENKRRLLAVHLSTLLGLPRLPRESMTELQSLRGKLNQTIAALTNLNRDPSALWNDLLVHVLVQSLDPVTRKAWNLRANEKEAPPSYDEIDRFIANRIRALEDCSGSSPSKATNGPTTVSRAHLATAQPSPKNTCPICKERHFFSACPAFSRGTPSHRRDLVKKHRRCFNCLSSNHAAPECKSKYTCRTCHQRHHSLLHVASESTARDSATASSPEQSTNNTETSDAVQSLLASTRVERRSPVLLATARVRVTSSGGRSIVVRALLDQGSEVTFVSENVAQLLRSGRVRMPTAVQAVGGVSAGVCRHATEIFVSSPHSPTTPIASMALILKSLTSYTPKRSIDASVLQQFAELPWADPSPLSQDPIDLLLGADIYGEVIRDGLMRSGAGNPVAQNTMFGWIFSGPVERADSPPLSGSKRAKAGPDTISVLHCFNSSTLEAELRRFWEVEELPRKSLLSPAEEKCENHFQSTHSRTSDGRYIVRLPFSDDPAKRLGSSRSRADRVLAALSRRLKNNPAQQTAYHDFLAEYESLGHMRRSPKLTPEEGVYIPHHPVFRELSETTKLRVVFNASSPTSTGTSLNDILLAGPKLQLDLSSVILRWRGFRYVYCADVAKMYRQILVDHRDISYQKIVWSGRQENQPVDYQLLTVTYGMSCAPFLALRVLRQLVLDEGDEFPLAAAVLKHHTYVDDVLFGSDDVETAFKIRDQLTSLLRHGGFTLRKWSSNSPDLLRDIDEADHGLACTKTLAADETIKVLGIGWLPSEDAFQINVSLPERVPTSKRTVLSTIAKLYDPLGWVTPATITAKVFMQQMWRQKLGWDDPLPESLLARWQQIYGEFSRLHGLRVPRWTGLDNSCTRVEVHGFADASSVAFSAVVYLKTNHLHDNATITLLTSKYKVAPLTPMSIITNRAAMPPSV